MATNPPPAAPAPTFAVIDQDIHDLWCLSQSEQDFPDVVGMTDDAKWGVLSLAEKFRRERMQIVKEEMQSVGQSIVAYTTELYQQIVIYSIFQGVILAAATQSSRLKCGSVWIFMVLSALVSVFVIGAAFLRSIDSQKLEVKFKWLKAIHRSYEEQVENILAERLTAVLEKRVVRNMADYDGWCEKICCYWTWKSVVLGLAIAIFGSVVMVGILDSVCHH